MSEDFIKRLLSEADTYLAKGDPVQASEKLYKVAEEAIKTLSKAFNLEEAWKAEEKGRWTITLLEKAVRRLAEKLGIDVQLAWDAAMHLHVWSFHEAKLEIEDVKARKPLILKLVKCRDME